MIHIEELAIAHGRDVAQWPIDVRRAAVAAVLRFEAGDSVLNLRGDTIGEAVTDLLMLQSELDELIEAIAGRDLVKVGAKIVAAVEMRGEKSVQRLIRGSQP
jgi:hypothetical protein